MVFRGVYKVRHHLYRIDFVECLKIFCFSLYYVAKSQSTGTGLSNNYVLLKQAQYSVVVGKLVQAED